MAFYKCMGGGGGSQPVLVTKTITQNGTYNASSDNADGYSQVTVNVSSTGVQFLVCNPADLIPNVYIKNDGSVEAYSGWSATDFISVIPNETIYYKSSVNLTYGCWYDSNKTYLSGVTFSQSSYNNITVPSGASYFRTSANTSQISYLTIWR